MSLPKKLREIPLEIERRSTGNPPPTRESFSKIAIPISWIQSRGLECARDPRQFEHPDE
jgi:hypothetical protein